MGTHALCPPLVECMSTHMLCPLLVVIARVPYRKEVEKLEAVRCVVALEVLEVCIWGQGMVHIYIWHALFRQ